MKKTIFMLSCLVFLTSCEKEGELTKTRIVTINNEAILKYTGTFAPTAGESASGVVKIFQEGNAYILKLENFAVSNGPDLKVYLSQASTATNFVNLGSFQGNGNTVYTIPAGINVANYGYVLIHCQQFNHTFAIAQLTSN